jgi:hypothetical protein
MKHPSLLPLEWLSFQRARKFGAQISLKPYVFSPLIFAQKIFEQVTT